MGGQEEKTLLTVKFLTQEKQPRCLFDISKLDRVARFVQHPSIPTCYRVP